MKQKSKSPLDNPRWYVIFVITDAQYFATVHLLRILLARWGAQVATPRPSEMPFLSILPIPHSQPSKSSHFLAHLRCPFLSSLLLSTHHTFRILWTARCLCSFWKFFLKFLVEKGEQIILVIKELSISPSRSFLVTPTILYNCFYDFDRPKHLWRKSFHKKTLSWDLHFQHLMLMRICKNTAAPPCGRFVLSLAAYYVVVA